MNKIKQTWTKNGFTLRPSVLEDAEEYFNHNFNPLDKEVSHFTGCKEVFTHDEVVNFFKNCIDDTTRYDFMIIEPDGHIIGETVINQINWKLRSANFRIAIFHPNDRGKGIGSWVIEKTRDFAFEKLNLHRLELDVFSFNPRAEKSYIKAGFKREGVLRDSIMDKNEFADDILMSILEDEWKEIYSGGLCCEKK